MSSAKLWISLIGGDIRRQSSMFLLLRALQTQALRELSMARSSEPDLGRDKVDDLRHREHKTARRLDGPYRR